MDTTISAILAVSAEVRAIESAKTGQVEDRVYLHMVVQLACGHTTNYSHYSPFGTGVGEYHYCPSAEHSVPSSSLVAGILARKGMLC